MLTGLWMGRFARQTGDGISANPRRFLGWLLQEFQDSLRSSMEKAWGLERAEKSRFKIQAWKAGVWFTENHSEMWINLSLCRPNNTDVSKQRFSSLIRPRCCKWFLENSPVSWYAPGRGEIPFGLKSEICHSADQKINQLDAGFNQSWLWKSFSQVCSWLVLVGSRICCLLLFPLFHN